MDGRSERPDLNGLLGSKMGERDGSLLQADAPTPTEKDYPATRFYRATRLKGELLVQFEVCLFAGARTMTYRRGDDGRFHRNAWGYFGGPACEALNAAFSGVTAPPGGWALHPVEHC